MEDPDPTELPRREGRKGKNILTGSEEDTISKVPTVRKGLTFYVSNEVGDYLKKYVNRRGWDPNKLLTVLVDMLKSGEIKITRGRYHEGSRTLS